MVPSSLTVHFFYQGNTLYSRSQVKDAYVFNIIYYIREITALSIRNDKERKIYCVSLMHTSYQTHLKYVFSPVAAPNPQHARTKHLSSMKVWWEVTRFGLSDGVHLLRTRQHNVLKVVVFVSLLHYDVLMSFNAVVLGNEGTYLGA